MSPLEIAIYVLLSLFALGMLGYVLRGFASGYTRLGSEVNEQESAFEKELLSEVAPLMEEPLGASDPPRPPMAPPPPAPPVPSVANSPGATPEAIARQLFALRIVTERQGAIPMPMPPDGAIYGLRRGGSCGILPRQESPEMMAHFAKRFDLVFFVGADGETQVLQRLQGRLPELLDQESDAPRA